MQSDAQFRKAIGQAIRAHRRVRGMSQISLGKAVGMDQAVVSRVENGSHGLHIEGFLRIADVLGVAPWVLAEEARQRMRKSLKR